MAFKVLQPGMLTLIQDTGRYGFQHLGITTSGPMDEYGFHWANYLLDNPVNAAQLEITYGQLSLEVTSETIKIAITGADLGATVNQRPVLPWQTYTLCKGDILKFDKPNTGFIAYLAISNGFDAPKILNSVATTQREHLGGLDQIGTKLKKGDTLTASNTSNTQPSNRGTTMHDGRAPKWAIPNYNEALSLGVMLGYQSKHFDTANKAKLFSEEYSLSSNINRMGYRLEGPKIQCQINGIVSEGIAMGAIQIPADGQPIILMRDRQTIGGYPKIGCISALDAGMLSQMQPGHKIRFHTIDHAKAEAKRMILNRQLGLGA